MTQQNAPVRSEAATCLLHNWVEERAVAALDAAEARTQIQRHGHRGIITMEQESKMETVTTSKAAYLPPRSLGVRLRGIRSELLENHIAQMISAEIHAEQEQPTPKTDFCSTAQRDFCVEGFVPSTPETTQVHDYKPEQAITFWSENCQQIQGVTGAQRSFRRSALFSTPISERLDEIDI